MALSSAPLLAGQVGSCLERYNIIDHAYYTSLNCTANESAISGVNLLVPGNQAGCLKDGDTTKYEVLVQLNGSNTDRYDLGIYLNTIGGSARSDTTANACFQEILRPNTGTVNLLSGIGPYPEYDGAHADQCGDIDTRPLNRWLMNGTSTTQHAQVNFTCNDTNNNGVMDLTGCVAYANVSGQNICSSFTGPGNQGAGTPGTTSKCSCSESETYEPPVPIADIASSCTCTHVSGTSSYNCTATLSNTAPVSLAAINPLSINSIQPGTAAYVRYKINDLKSSDSSAAGGTFTLGTPTNGLASLNTGGAKVLLTPRGGRCTAGSACDVDNAPENYVLGPGQTTTLPFTYSNTTANQRVILKLDTYKAVTNLFTYEEVRQTNTQCQVFASATYASIGEVSVQVRGGVVVFGWTTNAEAGTEGFDVYRQDADTADAWIKINKQLVPSVQNFAGGSYQLADPGAEPRSSHTYRLVEQDWRGERMELGPFTVSPARSKSRASATQQAHGPRPVSAQAHGADTALAARMEQSEKENSAIQAKQSKSGTDTVSAMKITVIRDGLYSIDAEEIAQAFGIDVKKISGLIKKYKFSLTNQGQSIAWEPGADDDSIRFYGQANTSPYSRENSYWLSPGTGLKMGAKSGMSADPVESLQGFEETVAVEKNLLTSPFFAPAPNDDFQFWKRAREDTPGGADFTIESPGAIDLGGDALLRVEVLRTVGTGLARISVNEGGDCSGDVEWLGADIVELSIPQSCLKPVNNVVVDSLDGNFVVDSLALTYARAYEAMNDALEFRGEANSAVTVLGFTNAAIAVYDLGDPRAPKRLDGLDVDNFGGEFGVTLVLPISEVTYLGAAMEMTPDRIELYSSAGLRDSGNRGNYLVIGDSVFSGVVTDLLDLRSTRMTEPMFIDLEDIMNEFNDGNFDPAAIRDFLSYASENWQLAPQSVALLGKGHFDFMDDQGTGNNLMPPLVARTSSAYLPADNLLGDITGDGMPEIAVGRIPVLSPSELAAYIRKLTDYERGPADDRDLDVHMVADEVDYKAGDFPFDSTDIISLLPATLNVQETFLFQPWTLAETQSRLLTSFTEGALLVNLIGHGSPLAFSGAPHTILSRTDAQSMTLLGPGQAPMVVALSCLISTFAVPGIQSLGEDLVINADGGAIAVLGPLALSVNQQSVDMGKWLLPALLDAGSGSIGSAYVASLREFVASGGNIESILLYSLLGDPMISLRNQ